MPSLAVVEMMTLRQSSMSSCSTMAGGLLAPRSLHVVGKLVPCRASFLTVDRAPLGQLLLHLLEGAPGLGEHGVRGRVGLDGAPSWTRAP